MLEKYSIRYSERTGWLCQIRQDSECLVCEKAFSKEDKCYYLENYDGLCCRTCLETERSKGKLWNFGKAYPVKMIKELPRELTEINQRDEW